MREICVIGGNRYVGKRLIARLLESGDRVTVINRGSSAPPAGVRHLVADRDDEDSLRAAIGSRSFDVVVDQVCYTPRQAEIAVRVFSGRTRRYVMTSTVEVYEYENSAEPVREDAVDPLAVLVDTALPWDDPAFREERYGEGKRQAEAVFAAAAGFPSVAVRVAHVLGGHDDFTARVDHYAERIRAGEPIAVPEKNHPATYVYVEEIADFLAWTTGQEFTGPVNAHANGPLTTQDICAAIERETGGRVEFAPVHGGETSPFSFARAYAMDNSRATALGYTFRHTSEWLQQAVSETLAARQEVR
ncbi:NAD-dependent epimerase/dehydratase family protein [Streptomyces sp. NPDC058685]|uniref:NAD-dependent epimerase/dehydratase family protein n=1 Tax=Streptomyces sp. NPDC058685 TaxID=3346598 RepID=UPI0036685FAB